MEIIGVAIYKRNSDLPPRHSPKELPFINFDGILSKEFSDQEWSFMNLWVFYNDGTLYDDDSSGKQFMEIALAYYANILGTPRESTPGRLTELKRKWQTEFSIIAVMRECDVSFNDVVNNTYLRVDLEQCGIPNSDPVKRDVLNLLAGEKVVLTNNPSLWARKVLSRIGLMDCFSDVIGMEETNLQIKPNPEAYRVTEQRHKGFNRIIFCDDALKNLGTARERGWLTILYDPAGMRTKQTEGHIVISSFDELRQFS